jgi:hypothetical protein
LKEETEMNMKIDALTKRLDALSTGPSINAAYTYPVDSCSICASSMHSAHNCPSAPLYFEYPMEQVNAFNDYRKQSNGLYSETYNPRWRSHPNFSWKQNQSANQGRALHHAHNQYPFGFLLTVPNHGRSAKPASTSAYQASTKAPASMSQSLEETLRDFIKMIGQSISDVKSATMVNTQVIAKLEMQMGQLANHLGERDKEKFPSQPKPNPKAFAIGNSSSSVHGQEQEHVQAIVTLKLSRQVDNHVVD